MNNFYSLKCSEMYFILFPKLLISFWSSILRLFLSCLIYYLISFNFGVAADNFLVPLKVDGLIYFLSGLAPLKVLFLWVCKTLSLKSILFGRGAVICLMLFSFLLSTSGDSQSRSLDFSLSLFFPFPLKFLHVSFLEKLFFLSLILPN